MRRLDSAEAVRSPWHVKSGWNSALGIGRLYVWVDSGVGGGHGGRLDSAEAGMCHLHVREVRVAQFPGDWAAAVWAAAVWVESGVGAAGGGFTEVVLTLTLGSHRDGLYKTDIFGIS